MGFLLQIFGYMLIYMAVDYNRDEESRLELFTVDWFVVLAMVTMGTLIITTVK